MKQNHLKNILRTSQYSYDRNSFLRLDANERVIPFKKKIILDLKKIISNPKKGRTIQSLNAGRTATIPK